MKDKAIEKKKVKQKILRPADIPPEVLKYLVERWAEHLKPLRHSIVELGLTNKTFTEKASDMPLPRLNYSFSKDGVLVFDWESQEDTGETILTYVDYENGYRALSDENFDVAKAFMDGVFKIEPSPEVMVKLAPIMHDMIRAHIKAIEDCEKKFNIEMPKYS